MQTSKVNHSFKDRELIIDLYKTMLKIRLTEEKIGEIYPTDKIQSPVHLSIGQEAVSTGVCLAMGKQDHIHGTYRGHGIYIARGGSLKKLFAELYGKDTGCARGRGGSMHLVAPEVGVMGCSAIVSSTIPTATGDALASQMQGRERVAVALFGDGAVDEGVFYESVNFALLKKLPIIYICENNNYAIHSKVIDRHRDDRLYKIFEGMGLEGKRMEGYDALAVYSSMKEVVESVRGGEGPFFLEYLTYRWKVHVGPEEDFEESYREKEKLMRSQKNDFMKTYPRLLQNNCGVSLKTLESWKEEIMGEIEEAVVFAEKSPFPKVEELCEFVYK